MPSVRIKTNMTRGTHMPILMKLVDITNGSILELGSGTFSTPYLHWACFPNRRLVTYEDHKDWFDRYLLPFAKNPHHQLIFVEDWDKVNIDGDWSIALIDHDPLTNRKRYQDVARLIRAEYVVCHDSENRNDHKYGYSQIRDLFKYSYTYNKCFPYTTIFSNYHDLKDFHVD